MGSPSVHLFLTLHFRTQNGLWNSTLILQVSKPEFYNRLPNPILSFWSSLPLLPYHALRLLFRVIPKLDQFPSLAPLLPQLLFLVYKPGACTPPSCSWLSASGISSASSPLQATGQATTLFLLRTSGLVPESPRHAGIRGIVTLPPEPEQLASRQPPTPSSPPRPEPA